MYSIKWYIYNQRSHMYPRLSVYIIHWYTCMFACRALTWLTNTDKLVSLWRNHSGSLASLAFPNSGTNRHIYYILYILYPTPIPTNTRGTYNRIPCMLHWRDVTRDHARPKCTLPGLTLYWLRLTQTDWRGPRTPERTRCRGYISPRSILSL